MIRIDAMWLATEPVDMRAGPERLLAQVVAVFGAAQAHHGYLFANARGTRMKLLMHDGFIVWCAARRLNVGPHFMGSARRRAMRGTQPSAVRRADRRVALDSARADASASPTSERMAQACNAPRIRASPE